MAGNRRGTRRALAGLLALLAGLGAQDAPPTPVEPPTPATFPVPELPTPAVITPTAPVSTAPRDIPPLGLPTPSLADALPNGATVSVPLRAVLELPPTALPPVELHAGYLPAVGVALREANPLPNSWLTAEALFWWTKGAPLPPLVTATRGTGVPRFGGPATTLLAGNGATDSAHAAGGRFGYGFAVNDDGTAALAVNYFFLGGRNRRDEYGRSPTRAIARPLFDPDTGAETAFPVGGTVAVGTSVRAVGWEVNGLLNLVNGPQARVHALAGYRYFQVHEGLTVTQLAAGAGGPRYLDQFDTGNTFHGGQVGAVADVAHGALFLEVTGKLALGQATAVVTVHGLRESGNLSLPAGVLAQPSNSGRYSQTAFAVLPEGAVKLGVRFRERSRLYVGYNLILLSEAARPGDQIDRGVALDGLANFAHAGPPLDRPAVPQSRGDFWAQGIVVGLEYRY
jgi:hypothetical protein